MVRDQNTRKIDRVSPLFLQLPQNCAQYILMTFSLQLTVTYLLSAKDILTIKRERKFQATLSNLPTVLLKIFMDNMHLFSSISSAIIHHCSRGYPLLWFLKAKEIPLCIFSQQLHVGQDNSNTEEGSCGAHKSTRVQQNTWISVERR